MNRGVFSFSMYKDNVLLKLDPPQRKSSGGIYVPEQERNTEHGPQMLAATVLKVGPGGVGTYNETETRNFFEMTVKAGDRVLVSHLCGESYRVGFDIKNSTAPDSKTGDEFRVVRCSEIEAILG